MIRGSTWTISRIASITSSNGWRKGAITSCKTCGLKRLCSEKLQELAESVSRLEPLVADRYAEVPWREVRAFRNVIVHDYLGLNLDRIWEIASRHVRELKPHIAAIARDLRDPMA